MKLKDKYAVVTGSSTGIGRAIAAIGRLSTSERIHHHCGTKVCALQLLDIHGLLQYFDVVIGVHEQYLLQGKKPSRIGKMWHITVIDKPIKAIFNKAKQAKKFLNI